MHSYNPKKPPSQAKIRAVMIEVVGTTIERDVLSRSQEAIEAATQLLGDLNKRVLDEIYYVPPHSPLGPDGPRNRVQRRARR